MSSKHTKQRIYRADPPVPGKKIILGDLFADSCELYVEVVVPGIAMEELSVLLEGNILRISLTERDQPRSKTLQRQQIIGESKELKRCLSLVAHAAATKNNVIICGATGTGKELFARAIHQNSPQADNDFVVVDCRSLPEGQTGEILFNSPSGTAAGLIHAADRGTLFLDEVGDLSMPTQLIMLQLLQSQCFCPTSGQQHQLSHFRVIAATNRSLEALVKQGSFSGDLLQQLNSLVIDLPPLQGRTEDIKLLTKLFLERFCQECRFEPKLLSPAFEQTLLDYPWPGNVRELRNTLEQTLLAAKHKRTLFPKDLPAHIRVHVTKATVGQKDSRRSGSTAPSFSANPHFAEGLY